MSLAEMRLLRAIQKTGERPRYAGWGLGLEPGHVVYLCLKWITEGLYTPAECSDTGWLTEKGLTA